MTYLILFAGFCGLFLGGELLVRGGIGMARRLGLPPLVIGLTIIGFGTSMPELLVSLQAALAGSPALAIGNVIGSNIANLLLILGAVAVIAAVPLKLAELRRDLAVMIAAMLVLWLLLASGTVTRISGIFLVAWLVGYLWQCTRCADETPAEDGAPPPPLWKGASVALVGLLFLMFGARFLVAAATDIARDFGVSEAAIGLTVIAVGTSLPELAAAVVAAFRGHPELAIGNVIGSNIFNILGILGVTSIVSPIPVDARFAGTDSAVQLASALVILGLAASLGRIPRIAGFALLLAYAAYASLAVA
ncbi:MAG: calcium/sodium antiporter [Rhodobacteraceae bacterium]|nr:calcium/sodium antiporter [Paracoccaceae bacterium]